MTFGHKIWYNDMIQCKQIKKNAYIAIISSEAMLLDVIIYTTLKHPYQKINIT